MGVHASVSTRGHTGRSARDSNPVMTLTDGPVPRIVQTTGSVHTDPAFTA